MNTRYIRYPELHKQGIVSNRMTLYRWIRLHDFPKGILLGPNTRVWSEEEVSEWIKTRKEMEQ
jgi:predicted DNA-binding transcriptional regulator AlpA